MRKIQVSIKVNPKVKEKLEAIALAEGEDFSEIVRQALNQYLENKLPT